MRALKASVHRNIGPMNGGPDTEDECNHTEEGVASFRGANQGGLGEGGNGQARLPSRLHRM